MCVMALSGPMRVRGGLVPCLGGGWHNLVFLIGMSGCEHSNLHWALRGMNAPPPAAVDGSDCDVCAICHDSLGNGQATLAYPCGHVFHRGCVHEYLSLSDHHVKCPLCMQSCPLLDVAHEVILAYRQLWAESLSQAGRPAQEEGREGEDDNDTLSTMSANYDPDPFAIPSPPELRRVATSDYTPMPVNRALEGEFDVAM